MKTLYRKEKADLSRRLDAAFSGVLDLARSRPPAPAFAQTVTWTRWRAFDKVLFPGVTCRRAPKRDRPGMKAYGFRLPEGYMLGLHYHEYTETLRVRRGVARVVVRGTEHILREEDEVVIAAFIVHEFQNLTEGEIELTVWNTNGDFRINPNGD